MNALPAPLRKHWPDLDLIRMARSLQGLLIAYERFAGPLYRGRSDPIRIELECDLLEYWTDKLGGQLSFARKLDGTPYGPLVQFLTLTLHAITGGAPGPSGIAKIIDQYRKAPDLPD